MSGRKTPLLTTWLGLATVFSYPLVRGNLIRHGVEPETAATIGKTLVWIFGIATLYAYYVQRNDFVRPPKKPRRKWFRRKKADPPASTTAEPEQSPILNTPTVPAQTIVPLLVHTEAGQPGVLEVNLPVAANDDLESPGA